MAKVPAAGKSAESRYRRVLLKLSGEALTDSGQFGLSEPTVLALGQTITAVGQSGTQIAIAIGGGNIWRGASHPTIERATSDTMGMMAHVINALALQNAIEQAGGQARVQTALQMPQVAEPYIRRRAIRHLDKNRIVIFAAGLGAPYFTTDTAAAQRALEIGADVLMKGTTVDGVYSADPATDPGAEHFARISYTEVLARELGVMDAAAVSLCRENSLPILVFDIFAEKALAKAVAGETVGTTVGP